MVIWSLDTLWDSWKSIWYYKGAMRIIKELKKYPLFRLITESSAKIIIFHLVIIICNIWRGNMDITLGLDHVPKKLTWAK